MFDTFGTQELRKISHIPEFLISKFIFALNRRAVFSDPNPFGFAQMISAHVSGIQPKSSARSNSLKPDG